MDAKTTATNTNNFEPLSDFVNEGDCDTLLVYLPGFTREQLRVQLARSGVLKISGTRSLGDNKWSSFHKDFPVTANCDTTKITAKFEDGILYVRQPKLIVPDKKPETNPKTNNHEELVRQPKLIVPDKKPETPKTNDHEEPHETTPDKPTTKGHEPKANSESSEGTKKSDDTPGKTARGDNVSGKDGAELENKGTESNYRDDHIANDKLSEGCKLDAESPAAKLKVARQKMTTALVVLFAFALGMLISKLQAWFNRDANILLTES